MTGLVPGALYILPFDHRESYEAGLFHWREPLTGAQNAVITASKQVIYDGFTRALSEGTPRECSGILVDERFGAAILRDARRQGIVTAMPVERSGQEEFDFEHGDAFARHIDEFDPTFVKALVRYNPDGDTAVNRRQESRLRRLSEYLSRTRRRFMFELLVPPTASQLALANGDRDTYDASLRPGLMIGAIEALYAAGIEPDVWKIEGLDRREDCVRLVDAARRDRGAVSCIVLGRGADEARVAHWLRTAAGVPGFIGFAVGRTTFWDAVAEWRRDELANRETAVAWIASRFRHWVNIFEEARAASTPGGSVRQ